MAFIPTFYLCFLSPNESLPEENAVKEFLDSWISEPAKNIYSEVSSYFSYFEEQKPEPTFQEMMWQFLEENQIFILSLFGEIIFIEVICYIYNKFIKFNFCGKQNFGEQSITQSQ